MRKNGYNLGGEQSGHVIIMDYNTTGDGQLSAVRIIGHAETGRNCLNWLLSDYLSSEIGQY